MPDRNPFIRKDSASRARSASRLSYNDKSAFDIKVDSDEVLEIEGYGHSKWGTFVYLILGFLTLGFFFYFCSRYPRLQARIRKKRMPLDYCSIVLLRNVDGSWYKEKVKSVWVDNESYRAPSGVRSAAAAAASALNASSDSSDNITYNNVDHNASSNDGLDSNGGNNRPFLMRVFEFRCARYIYDPSADTFMRTRIDLSEVLFSDSTWKLTGLDSLTHKQRLLHYGANVFDFPIAKGLALFRRLLMEPFYFYNIFVTILFMPQPFRAFGFSIFSVTLFSLFVEFGQKLKEVNSIKSLLKSEKEIRVVRGGKSSIAGSAGLVPGDVLELTGRVILPCDVAMLTGAAEVDESMLTGDTLPVQKDSLSRSSLSPFMTSTDLEAALDPHTISGGSKVLGIKPGPSSTSNSVLCVVLRTGFHSATGQVIRSAVFSNRFTKVERTSHIILAGFTLGLMAFIVAIIQVVLQHGLHEWKEWVAASDSLALALPPMWPAVVCLDVWAAVRRLLRTAKGTRMPIVSRIPAKLPSFAEVDHVCFDKTGVLTSNILSLYAVVHVNPGLKLTTTPADTGLGDEHEDLIKVMATCHSLQRRGKAQSTKLAGDPLEEALFSATRWTYSKSQDGFTVCPPIYSVDEIVQRLHVFRSFAFSSTLRRMTVLARSEAYHPQPAASASAASAERGMWSMYSSTPSTSRASSVINSVPPSVSDNASAEAETAANAAPPVFAFVKGSPREIKELCRPDSIPPTFDAIVTEYSLAGLRLLACAKRVFGADEDVDSMPRSELESQLEFVGFLLLENKLKPNSKEVVASLQRANIRCLVFTGDSPYTSISVSQSCGILQADVPVLLADAVKDPESGRKAIKWTELHRGRSREVEPNSAQDDSVYCEVVMTGAAFSLLRHTSGEGQKLMWHRLLVRCKVFAAMGPVEKAELIRELQDDLHCSVASVGDGNNDSAALAASKASVTLSEAESSFAAPFICERDVSCILKLIREGRAVAATRLHSLKYLALYLTILYSASLIIYSTDGCHLHLEEWQIVYVFMASAFGVTLTMPFTGAYHRISRRRHPAGLFSPITFISLFGHALIHCGTLLWVHFEVHDWPNIVTTNYPGYKQIQSCSPSDFTRREVLFAVANFQYVWSALAFSQGRPFRKPFYKNAFFCVWLIALVIVNGVFLIGTSSTFIDEDLNSLHIDDTSGVDYRSRILRLLPLLFACLVACIVWERWLIAIGDLKEKYSTKGKRLETSKKLYEQILSTLSRVVRE